MALGPDRPQHWVPVVAFLAVAGLLWIALLTVSTAASFVVLDHAVRGRRIGVAAARRRPGSRRAATGGAPFATLLVSYLVVQVITFAAMLVVTLVVLLPGSSARLDGGSALGRSGGGRSDTFLSGVIGLLYYDQRARSRLPR